MTKRKAKRKERFLWPKAGAYSKDIRRSSIVQVDWSDACARASWSSASHDPGLVNCTSVGYLLHKKRGHITLAITLAACDDAIGLMCIPLNWVHRIKVIQRAP
jgi:hypothetical protein